MKFLFDLFPVILFFATFKWAEGHPHAAQSIGAQYLSSFVSDGVVSLTQAPVLLATCMTLLATLLQILYLLVRRKKVDTMLWISLVIIGFFGSATIYFHNEQFIKWKPTVLYWCFASALGIGYGIFKKNWIRTVMEQHITLPDLIWKRLLLAWLIFFSVLGFLNLYVAFSYPIATWVNFKLFGVIGLMLVFIIGQSLFLSKYMAHQK